MTPARLTAIRSEARAKGYVPVETVEELVDEVERLHAILGEAEPPKIGTPDAAMRGCRCRVGEKYTVYVEECPWHWGAPPGGEV